LKKFFPFIFISIFACTPPDIYIRLNSQIAQGNYIQAIGQIKANKDRFYPEKNALLYHLDLGLLNHLAGNYKESNQHFEKAKRLAEEFYTKSITKEASTFLINDTMRPYYGEDFEIALIYFFKALNYTMLGDEEGALVEARQMNYFFQELETRYGTKNAYKGDPAIRYIMGLIYENAGDLNSALIEYKNAIRLYKKNAPRELLDSAYLLAKKLGFSDDVQWFRKLGAKGKKRSKSEIVILHLNGPAPKKINHFIELSFGEGWAHLESVKVSGKERSDIEEARAAARAISAKEIFRVAFPKYIQPKFSCASAEVEVSGANIQAKTKTISDISRIAIKNLSDRIARIRTKAIARAWIKYALAKKAEKKVSKKRGLASGWLAGATLRAIGAATETADLRCWGTLPARIDIARIPVKPGQYHLRIYFKDDFGKIISQKVINDIKVKKNKKTFVTVRTLF